MAKKETTLTVQAIVPKIVEITITGTTDLILNKMDDVTSRELTSIRNDEYVDKTIKANPWEKIITSIHWLNKVDDFSKEGLDDALTNNKPCITCFGMKKAMGEAVTRNNISAFSTSMRATVNVIGDKDNLIPIQFNEYHLDEKIFTGRKGAILAKLNRFCGWSATFKIEYLESAYSLEQIVNIINLAGFGGGIGSGRSSDYGRFRVTAVTQFG